MTGRVLHGLCGVMIAAGFLTSGIDARRSPSSESAFPMDPGQVPPQARAALSGGVTWNFETGNLLGWQASGTAFATQPTYGDNPRARQRESANPQGQYWIGTYERYQGPGRGKSGDVQGDEPRGTLTSTAFTIPPSLTFRIGGGSSFETRVELVVLDQIEGEIRAIYASGKDSETMQETSWNLATWAGRQGRLRIVDASSGPWGHINADDFRFGGGLRGVDIATGEIGRARGGGLVEGRTTVPSLSGSTEDEARKVLAGARLAVGEVTRAEADARPGTVFKQDPAAGSLAVVNTRVSFVLALPIRVQVPRLVDRTEGEARDLIARARLRTGTIRRQQSPLPPGQVLAQEVEPGQWLPIGSALNFVVAERKLVDVPRLVSRTQQQATDLLKKLELGLGAVRSEESRRPSGTVLTQEPPAGQRVGAGSLVDIVVAIPVRVQVPELVTRSEADARRMLTEAELEAGAVTVEEAQRPPGSVLRQGIAPGTRVTIGTAVDLVTASPVTVPVPALVGLSEDQARQQLAAVQLTAGSIQYQESASEPGTVLAQAVSPPTRVPLGTPVDFVLAAAETVPVPSLVGLTIEEARRRLTAGRLALGEQQLRGTRVEPRGTVLAQSLQPDTRAAVGTQVSLTVATLETVSVPAVVGRSHDEAVAALAGAGLAVGTVSPQFSLRAGGTVLTQSLVAGTQVQVGTPVAMDEARARGWMAPVGAVLLVVIAGLVILRPGRGRGRLQPEDDSAPVPPLDVEIRANVDVGDARVQPDEARTIQREVRLELVIDRGVQDVSAVAGDLVRGERQERTPGAPPPEDAS
jgi:beta-lactam-binding protein with PASTA domain